MYAYCAATSEASMVRRSPGSHIPVQRPLISVYDGNQLRLLGMKMISTYIAWTDGGNMNVFDNQLSYIIGSQREAEPTLIARLR
jgi:hypothetical protein